MGSELGDNEGGDPIFDWDSTAEEELRSIEESYANSKRQISPPLPVDESSSAEQRPKRRCLPSWANASPPPRNWVLFPPPCRSDYKLKYPQMNFRGRIVYCRTTVEAEQAARELLDKINVRKQDEDRIAVGFDIEWRPTFGRGEPPTKAALMQICMDVSSCYLFHIIHCGIPQVLKLVLEDSSSVKVGVWVANDAMKISRDYNTIVEPLDDLAEYANLKLGTLKKWSLAALTEMLTCKELAKPPKIRMGNWEATPLSKEQLQYAATDAFASWYLYEVLKTFPDAQPQNEDDAKTMADGIP